MFAFFAKGRTHKYIKKLPVKSGTGKQKWRYIYPSDLGASRSSHIESGGKEAMVAAMPFTLDVENLPVGTVLSMGDENAHIKVIGKKGGRYQVQYDHEGHPKHGRKVLMTEEKLKLAYEEKAQKHNSQYMKKKFKKLLSLVEDHEVALGSVQQIGRLKSILTKLEKTEQYKNMGWMSAADYKRLRERVDDLSHKAKQLKYGKKKTKIKKIKVTTESSVPLDKELRKTLEKMQSYVVKSKDKYSNDQMHFYVPPEPKFTKEEISLMRSIALFTTGNVKSCRNPEEYKAYLAKQEVEGPRITVLHEDNDYSAIKSTSFFNSPAQTTLVDDYGFSLFTSDKEKKKKVVKADNEISKENYEQANKHLKALAKAPLSGMKHIFRGMSIKETDYDAIMEALKSKDTYSLDLYDFTSFTTKYNTAYDFAQGADTKKDGEPYRRAMFVIENPTRGTHIEAFSGYQAEREVITGGHMKITRWENIKGLVTFYGTHDNLTPEELKS